MQETVDNIWKYQSNWIVVPTNGMLNKFGHAIMGAGVAKQAAFQFKELPILLGEKIREFGNEVFIFPDIKIIAFPTKNDWKNKSDLDLIIKGCERLKKYIEDGEVTYPVYSPRLGCGLGGLDWETVRPILEPLNLIIMSL